MNQKGMLRFHKPITAQVPKRQLDLFPTLESSIKVVSTPNFLLLVLFNLTERLKELKLMNLELSTQLVFTMVYLLLAMVKVDWFKSQFAMVQTAKV